MSTGAGFGGPLAALTGGSGFLGSHIADALLEAGWRVRCAVRPTSDRRRLSGKGLEIVDVDLGSPEACRSFVRDAAAVIHCAGLVAADSEAAYFQANVHSTGVLLEACRETWAEGAGRQTFLLVSSLAAHGPAGLDRPAREEAPCRPITGYGRSKAAAEELVGRGWPFRCLVLRPPALYGPRDRGFLPLLRAARRGWTARFSGPMQGLSLVDGRDAARAAVALVATPAATGTFFVDDGRAGYTWAELADALGEACGRRVRTVVIPLGLLRTVAAILRPLTGGGVSVLRRDRIRDLEVPGWACDGSRLREATGFSARYRLGPGLADALAFYREEGWL
ncbi:MAG: NAD-dependent epimerase/dehydratase family protein [Candidatus Krumholzibacteriia bacterium]